MTKGRQAFHNTVIGRDLRLLRRAMRRVPTGMTMNNAVRDGFRWDAHTGLMLRPRPVAA